MHSEFWWGNLENSNLQDRSRRRWEDNIKTDLWEVSCENGVGWNGFQIMSSSRLWYLQCLNL
jgi:hypothetical protein